MIIFGTKNIKINDNCGILNVKCIKILGGSLKKKATLGNTIIISVKKKKHSVIKNINKSIYFGLVVNINKNIKRKQGNYYLNFKQNKIIVFDEGFKFLGTRLKGIFCKEIKNLSYIKLYLIAKHIL
jgi:large subunit ribosomal protein L14